MSKSSCSKRLRGSRVSSWITPSEWPSRLINGAHIIERMWKSTMLSAMSKRASVAASAERIASLLAITLLTMVRLMRTLCLSSWRRYLMALGMSRPVGGSRSTMKPRSAWRKIANRLSSSLGNTSARPRAIPRFWLISIRAFSFAAVFTSSRKPVEPVETFIFDMIVERSGGCWSSSTMRASAVMSPRRAEGVARFGCGGPT